MDTATQYTVLDSTKSKCATRYCATCKQAAMDDPARCSQEKSELMCSVVFSSFGILQPGLILTTLHPVHSIVQDTSFSIYRQIETRQQIRSLFLLFFLIAKTNRRSALFVSFISCTFSANEQCFSLTTNQRTVLSVMTFQPREQACMHTHANTCL
jgi:hypothetical protein